MKLNENNYYSNKLNKQYMSYSQFKDFLKCPDMAIAKIKGKYVQEKTDALLVGSYVDSWLDGELDKFKIANPDIFLKSGELKASFKKAEELCKTIQKDKILLKYLKGERQVIFTCNIAGVEFKTKIDSLHKDKIVDGKVLKDCNEVWIDGIRYPFYMANRYDIQAAIYQTAVLQNTGKKLPFILGIVTKESVPDRRLIEISQDVIDDALQEIINLAPTFKAMKQGAEQPYRCDHCDWCKQTRKTKLEVL